MVLYFGDPRGALALLDRGVPLAGVVHGRRGGVGLRSLLPRLAGVPRWIHPDLDDPVVRSALAALRPRLLVSAFYPRLIPAPLLALAPGINVHPSDLPRWRGPDPCFWTIRRGDATTALCVHRLTVELDAGEILLRELVAVGPRETGWALSRRLEARGAELIAQVAAEWLAGRLLPAKAQQGEVTWAPHLDPGALEIDWGAPSADVDRLVRAASPDPGAFTGLGGELLVILGGRPVELGRFGVLEPSTPYVQDALLRIRCGEGAYEIRRARLGCRGAATLAGRALARLMV